MKKLDRNIQRIKDILKMTCLLESERTKKIESVLSDVYDLGHAAGYAERFFDDMKEKTEERLIIK